MAQIPALISEEYPELALLYEHDIRFSDVLPDIQFEFGKTLAVMHDTTWKRFASELGLTAEDIMYATTLKAHNGSDVLNMFDIYMTRYKNSLLEIVHVLSKLGNKRALSKIKNMWTDILESQRRVTRSRCSPDEHQMTLLSVDSEVTEEHTVREDSRHETFRTPSSDSSIITDFHQPAVSQTPVKQYHHQIARNQYQPQRHPCQQTVDPCSPTTSYARTRAWVEKHSIMTKNNRATAPIKEERPAVSDFCSTSNETMHIQLMQGEGGSVTEFSNKKQIEANSVKQKSLMGDTFVKAENVLRQSSDAFNMPSLGSNTMNSACCRVGQSTSDMLPTKLPSFSTSFHKGQSVIENGSFNPLAQVANGDCSVILNKNTSVLDNGQNVCDAELMDIGSLDRSTTGIASSGSCYHTMPLSKSQEKRLDAMIYRKSGNFHLNVPAVDALRKSPSCTGKVESCPYGDSMRNSSVFITHLYRGLSTSQTKSESFNNKCAISLGCCLKENRFRVQMDVPKQSRVPGEEDWRNWLDRKFSSANFIIVCITPEYLEVVNSLEIEDNDELTDNIQSTRYVYHLMQHEFEENNGINSRFIPVLFRDPQHHPIGFLPNFLQMEGMGPYIWSRDYMDLLWRLDRHEVHLSNINGMT